MKNIFLVIFIISTLLQSCDLIQELLEGETEYINKSQLYIGDLTLFLSKDEMIKYLGKPDSIINQEYYYDDEFTIIVQSDKIWDIVCKSPKYATPDGIKIGDTKEKVIETYGQTKSIKNKETEIMFYESYSTFNSTVPLYLILTTKNNIVEKIQLWFHYE